MTGRVFQASGRGLGIAEGWRAGPEVPAVDDPDQLRPIVAELMARARLNADMQGNQVEGPGRPAHTI